MAPGRLAAAIRQGQLGVGRTVLLGIFLIFSTSFIFALDPTSQISQYGHTVWRVQDGYFGGRALHIAQTTDGYIWVGTDAGLYKFDGVRFVRWSARSGEDLPSPRIMELLGARDGSLWIGTDAGLAHLVNNQLMLNEKGQRWWISGIMEDRDGKIWLDHHRPDDDFHPLCQVVDNGVRCYGKDDGVDAEGGGPVVQDASGDLWLGGPTTLVRWRPGASKVYRPKPLRSNEGNGGIMALVPATDGSLWVGIGVAARGAGLQRMVDGSLKPFVAPKFNGETLEVVTLCSDRQKNLWVGTTRGLYRIHGVDVEHYGSDQGLSGDFVLNIFEDREGNVWVATSQGLDMFRDLRVRSISKREGLSEDGVESLAPAPDGSVWVGTSHVQVLGPHGVSPIKLPGNQATSLFVDHAGRLWAGTVNQLFVCERGRVRQITKQDGSALGMAMGITEDSEQNIWVETLGPPMELVRIQDLKVRQEFPPPEMPLARRVAADPKGGIWLGLMTGDLARYRDGHIDTFTFSDHPKSPVRALTVAADGSVLGGTPFGVIGWKDGKQQILSVRNSLPCNTVSAVVWDDARNLWLDTQCGLIEIPSQQMDLWWEHPESKLTTRVFDTSDGVQPGLAHFNAGVKTPDGRLWFANGNVVQVIDPAHIAANTLPPPVDISALVADRKDYPLEATLRLPALTRDLEIDYTALSYAAPQKVLFRYMLEGHDAGWQEPGTRRQAFYNDLRPGHYRFHVIACNNDGVWNQAGTALEFSILPAYYQTAWFRALCAIAFLLLLWSLYQMRVRQLHRQFAIGLEARVNERTRIARELHDTMLQSFQAVLMKLHAMAFVIREHPPEAEKTLGSVIEQVSEAITEGREAVQGMRTSTLVVNDLARAISMLGEDLAEQQADENRTEFRMDAEGTSRELLPLIRDDVYRIVSEALRNAFKHSQATRIEVELRYDPRELRVRIRDNGKGIEPKVLAEGGRVGHYGLPGMKERAKLVGGKLEVWSELGSGTETKLTIPASVAYAKSHAALWSRFGKKGA
jgi:signal transduction histidine kinase/ligand-binding sensor domain-containing protein